MEAGACPRGLGVGPPPHLGLRKIRKQCKKREKIGETGWELNRKKIEKVKEAIFWQIYLITLILNGLKLIWKWYVFKNSANLYGIYLINSENNYILNKFKYKF